MTPTISDPTLFVRGPDNVRPHAFRGRLQFQAPNMTPTISGPTPYESVWDVTDNTKICRASEGREKAVRWRSIPTTETQDTQVTVHSLVRVGTAIIRIPSRVIGNNRMRLNHRMDEQPNEVIN